jgi:hypothetical protein
MAIFYDTTTQTRYGRLGLAKAGLNRSSPNIVELEIQSPNYNSKYEQYFDTGEVEVIDGKYFVKYLVEDRDLEEVKNELKVAIATVRYNTEIAGTTLEDGTKVLTDRDTQAAANNVYTALSNGFITNANWKNPEGWTTVTSESFLPIISAISDHVKACFDIEFNLVETLNSITEMSDLKAFEYTQAFEELQGS